MTTDKKSGYDEKVVSFLDIFLGFVEENDMTRLEAIGMLSSTQLLYDNLFHYELFEREFVRKEDGNDS